MIATMEVRSTIRHCESTLALHNCFLDAVDSTNFDSNVQRAEAIVEYDGNVGANTYLCLINLITSSGVLTCSATSVCGKVAINIATKRAEELLHHYLS